jgi:hypothetical protein
MSKFFTRYFLAALSLIAFTASAQVEIKPGIQTTQNFNSLSSSAGVSQLPSGWKADKNASVVRALGTYANAGTATELLAGANMSTTAGNGLYNCGPATNNTDRGVGAISSGSATKSANFYVQLRNASTSAIGSLALSYDIEKYRKGSNPAGFRIQLFYSFDGVNWTDAGAAFTTAFAADLDNTGYSPAPGAVTTVNASLPVTIPANTDIYLAWNYAVTSGTTTTNAQALALDNFSVTPAGFISTNANLSALELSAGTINFSSAITDYTISVQNNVTSLIVKPTTADANATVTVNGQPVSSGQNSQPINLMVGTNAVIVNVKAEDGVTTKSYNVNVNRAAPAQPLLSVTSGLNDFGNICINRSSISSYTLSGSQLDGTNIQIDALSNFSYSLAATGPFQSSLNFNYTNGSFTKAIYVKFEPTITQSYNGNIILNGGGVSNFAIAVTGAGVNTSAAINTNAASNTSATTAVLNGAINTVGCDDITAYGFEYSTTSGFSSGTVLNANDLSSGNFTATVSSLISNTTYYYKAFVTTAAGTAYGAQQSFTAKPSPVIMRNEPYMVFKETFTNISSWGNSFTGGNGAEHFGALTANTTGSIPSATRITAPTTIFASGSSGGVQKGTGNIQLLSTGASDNTTSCAIDLYLDFTGVNAGTLSFDWASVANSTGDRKGSLRVYASDNGSTFTELSGAAVLNFTNNVATSGSISQIALPSSFNNNPNVRLRFYYHNGSGGATGSRPKISIDNLSVTSVSTTPCATPAAAPTNLTFSNIDETTVDVSFTPSSSSVTEYLVVVSADSELSSNPVDGEVYEVGDNLGDGFVVAKTHATSFKVSGLTAGTKYYFFVFPVNSVCVGSAKYLTTNILSQEVTTKAALLPCTAPTEQATALKLSSTTKIIQGSFTASNANEYLVVRSIGALNTLPVNGTTYKAGEVLGNATVIQRSANTNFTASGLAPDTEYNIYVFGLNNTECLNGPAYNVADALTGTIKTQALQPCATPATQPTNIAFNVSNETIAGTFNGITGDMSYLVIRSNMPTLTATPSDGMNYTAGAAFGGGTVVAVTESTSFTANNLTAATQYYFFVFATNNNCLGGTKYLTINPLTASATTTNAPKYNYYFGNLHAHSDYSDGNQDRPGYTPTQDWEYATTAQGMDFLGISEHNHFSSANNPGTLITQYHSGVEEARAFNKTHPNFLALYGMEWGVISGGGHVVVYGDDMKELFGWESNVGGTTGNNYDVYVPKNTYIGAAGLFKNINDFKAKNAFAMLAHPNSDDYNNLSNIAYNAVADSAIVGTAVESGPSGSTNTTYSNPGSPMSYLWYYQKMLSRGYRLGPVIDHDNHKTTFGKTTPARTAVLATELTSSALVQAIRDMRFYATEDIDAKVDFTVNTKVMGSIFTDRNAPAISVKLSDATTNTSNAIIRIMHGLPGSGAFAVQVDSIIGSSLNFVHADLPVNATGYYYADITNGTARIITSPIWYTRTCELTTTLNEKACSNYTWNGETYTTSGTYTKQFRTTGGCDSIVTLNLIINQPTSGDTTAVVCDSFTWYGQTFTSSTTATHTLTNAAGCDSIVTLHLTVNVSPKVNVSAESSTVICPRSSVTLTATADQAVTYQWLLNGNIINGASSNTYAATATGNYSVVVLNTNNCSTVSNNITVTVQDNTAPVPDVATLPTINGECSATVTAPTATDDCAGKLTATTTDAISFSSQGTYVIHWKFDDGNGNTTVQEQTVIIKDVTNPVITCAPSQFFCYNTNNNYTVPALNANDNCSIVSVQYTIQGATQRSGTGNNASGVFNIGNNIITWKVTDINGNVSECTTAVTVNSPVTVSIPDVYAVAPGGDVNTLYLGYGATSVTLNANAAGGTPVYTYNWSTGANTSLTSASVSAGTSTYSVVATDAQGCTGAAQKTIYVVDVRSGNKLDKVTICHKNNTLSIGKDAVADHLQHGDRLGACAVTTAMRSSSKATTSEALEISSKPIVISPVPNRGVFTVVLNDWKAGTAEISITDGNGRVAATRKVSVNNRSEKIEFNLPGLAQGSYNVTATSAGRKENARMIVNR